MDTEVLVFISFCGLQGLYHWLESTYGKHAWLQQLAHCHIVVLALHPAVIHGVQDYLIHFVVYSGKVIAAH